MVSQFRVAQLNFYYIKKDLKTKLLTVGYVYAVTVLRGAQIVSGTISVESRVPKQVNVGPDS